MSLVGRLAVLMVAGGIGVTALVPDPPSRTTDVANGYTILAGDFHVHSYPDGLPAWEVVREAHRRRLDVVALTSHNWLAGWTMWTHAPYVPRGAADVIVLPGEELTGVGYHLALVGLSQAVPWHQPSAAAVAATHAQHAVAILAHPAGKAVARAVPDEALAAMDGIEAAHPVMEEDDESRRDLLAMYQRRLALAPATAAVGSSDFHFFAPVGVCRTFLFVRERTAAGVLEALRAGRTVACDARGQTYGPAALTSAVIARCREAASQPADGDTGLTRAGTWLTLAGLLTLVLVGPVKW
jgi:hypothetical protein